MKNTCCWKNNELRFDTANFASLQSFSGHHQGTLLSFYDSHRCWQKRDIRASGKSGHYRFAFPYDGRGGDQLGLFGPSPSSPAWLNLPKVSRLQFRPNWRLWFSGRHVRFTSTSSKVGIKINHTGSDIIESSLKLIEAYSLRDNLQNYSDFNGL